ncbi:MAG: ClbS/DfsB family four-helix bundle protein [Acidimicrobiales bacterium]
MPATTKDDLLAVTQKEFAKLDKLLGQVDEQTALVKDEDDTSIKDLVGHRAHWIGLFFGWYHDGLDGKEVFFPAEGYKWNDLKKYNAALRAEQADLDWATVCGELLHAHDELIDFIERSSDGDLYGGPMVGANNQWTPGRWAEAAGPSHYRSAAKYIRARLKT